VLVRKLTDVIVAPCAETQAGTFGTAAFAELAERLSWADVVVLGPGLSRHVETDRLVHRLVGEIPCPLVLDADGLNAMGGKTSILKRRKSPTILTPHTGELSRLVGGESADHDRLRVEAARKYARALKSILVLKGAPTVTAHDGTAIVNSTGNPGMATIGSGDVLGGIIAGLIGQHAPCFESAYAGVYIHGMAGDSAAEHFGERSILATDILAHIPDALKALA
jgi:NAD(P)H-hydrate epimerase